MFGCHKSISVSNDVIFAASSRESAGIGKRGLQLPHIALGDRVCAPCLRHQWVCGCFG